MYQILGGVFYHRLTKWGGFVIFGKKEEDGLSI